MLHPWFFENDPRSRVARIGQDPRLEKYYSKRFVVNNVYVYERKDFIDFTAKTRFPELCHCKQAF